MQTISLNGIWQLKGQQQNCDTASVISLDATVPGCVQLDLSKAGYLPEDLYMGENILKAEKYEDYEWWYSRTFVAPDSAKNAYLVFDGVDCLAEYFLNGVKLGESKNMFIAQQFRVDHLLQAGKNILTVHILSATLAANAEDYPIRLLHSHNIDGCYLRKPAHSFGWDIMPRAVTAGLWRDVRLEMRDSIYFSQAFVHANRDTAAFYYTTETDSKDFSHIEIELEGKCKDSTVNVRFACKQKLGCVPFTINNPKLWYPYGYGEANVYDCKLRIYDHSIPVHEEDLSFGIREVTLDRRDPDNFDDGQFRILINGVEIMCKGSNWVGLDAFHCRDAQRYDEALSLVKDIGCNILRCWGGSVYEDHPFYDFCDRNGIMVWQDFSMACTLHPENEDFIQNLKAEATAVIRKLRNHPSIILWAGDNEVDSAFPQYDPNANKITRDILPNCVRDNDLGRPYLPSSPYISPKMYAAGAASQVPGSPLVEDHLWGPRDYYKSDFYSNNKAHFVSETGYHGCPSLASIKKFISAEKVWPYHNNSEWILHSSDQKGNDGRVMLMEQQVRQLFGTVPSDPQDYILASQISQAEAKKYFIERMRVGRPKRTGIIWWNLLDGWPQMSDAVVDYYFTKKLAYKYIKRSQAPFCIAADEISDWKIKLFACNDTLQPKAGHFTVTDAETNELLIDKDFTAEANASTCIVEIPVFYSAHKVLLIHWMIDGEAGFNHYLCGYPPFDLAWYKKILKEQIL